MFEVISRAVFGFLALGFGGLFLWRLIATKVPFRDWADEQKWTLLLLVSVLGLDDPLFVLSIKFALFDAVDQLLAAWFLSVLLLFWLVMLDSMLRTQETSTRSFKQFYLPKLALVGAFWLSVSALYVTAEMVDDFARPVIIVLFVVTILIASLYFFWIGVLAVKLVPVLRHAQLRVRFFSLFTAAVILFTLAGVLFGFLGPLRASATEFLAFFGLFNFYTFVLVICYLPGTAPPSFLSSDKIHISGGEIEDFDVATSSEFEISLSDVGMQQPTRSFSPIQDDDDDDGLL
jgi:hypothetical protein